MMAKKGFAPWHSEEALEFLDKYQPWKRMLKDVRETLEKEPRNFPHQIRAAAAFVIMFARDGIWPVQGGIRELDSIVDLARRQLTVVRQMYSLEGRNNKKLLSDPTYKALLRSMEEEIRILDSRLSDETSMMPNLPPCTWGEHFGKRSNPSEIWERLGN